MTEWDKVKRQILLGLFIANNTLGIITGLWLLYFKGIFFIPFTLISIIIYVGAIMYMAKYLEQREDNENS